LSNLNLIEPRPKDLDVLVELVKSYYEFDRHLFDAGLVKESLENLIKEPTLGKIWLIDLSDEIYAENKTIGYIILTFGYSLEFHGRDAFIDEFFIVETMRRKGLGKKVIALVLEKAKTYEIKAIHLEVVTTNHSAYEFYSKIGFTNRSHHLLTKKI
jgi:GNAT superfamily N-acetyltransferase